MLLCIYPSAMEDIDAKLERYVAHQYGSGTSLDTFERLAEPVFREPKSARRANQLKIAKLKVQSSRGKYSACAVGQIGCCSLRVPCLIKRGVSRSSRTLG
jgi:hypothetical protein